MKNTTTLTTKEKTGALVYALIITGLIVVLALAVYSAFLERIFN